MWPLVVSSTFDSKMSSPFDAGREPEEFSVVSHETRTVEDEVPLAQPDVVHSDVSEPSAKSAKAHISDIQISERRAMISTLVDDEVKHLEISHKFRKFLAFSEFLSHFSAKYQYILSFSDNFCEIPGKFHQNFAEKSQNSSKNANEK